MIAHRYMYRFITAAVVFTAIALTGCRTDKRMTGPNIDPSESDHLTSLENPAGQDLPPIQTAGRNEVDLVEKTIYHRAMYARHLRVLVQFYTENGNVEKANWARNELRDVQLIKPYNYIGDQQAAIASLSPTESIPEADRLYEEGVALMKEGGHGIPIFYNQKKMKQAMAKFKLLIEQYPSSDKIDDAAFQIGELHMEYFEEKDNRLAIMWYERAISWDPETPHPARFRMASIYDYRLKDHEKALEMYQAVVQHEAELDRSNLAWSNDRIDRLTRAYTREVPGERLPGGGEAEAAGPAAPAAP